MIARKKIASKMKEELPLRLRKNTKRKRRSSDSCFVEMSMPTLLDGYYRDV